MAARFRREARAPANLHHRNICPVFDVGQIGGVDYLTMAYIDGKPLSSYITRSRPLRQRQVVLVVRKLALALQAAHDAGVIHRDVKPSNVLIDSVGEPVLTDFGLAGRLDTSDDSRLTQSGSILGTPAYMSPEQIQGDQNKIGPRSDIFALGIVLYELLAGRLPFQGSAAAVMGQILVAKPPPLEAIRPSVDVELAGICSRMMAKSRSKRFANMREVADALTEVVRRSRLNEIPKPPTTEQEAESERAATDTAADLAAIAQLAASNDRRVSYGRGDSGGAYSQGDYLKPISELSLLRPLSVALAIASVAVLAMLLLGVNFQNSNRNQIAKTPTDANPGRPSDGDRDGGSDVGALLGDSQAGALANQQDVESSDDNEISSSPGNTELPTTESIDGEGRTFAADSAEAKPCWSIELRRGLVYGNPCTIGDRIAVQYELRNSSSEVLEVPGLTDPDGTNTKHLLGKMRFWVGNSGKRETDLPGPGNISKNTLWERFKSIDMGGQIAPGVEFNYHHHILTDAMPAGEHLFLMEFLSPDNEVIDSDTLTLRINPAVSYPAIGRRGRLEGEALHAVGRCGGVVSRQEMTNFADEKWSGDRQILWLFGKLNFGLVLGFQIEDEGEYEINGMFTHSYDFGVVDVEIDGRRVVSRMNLYNEATGLTERSLGRHTFRPGRHLMTVRIRGADARAGEKRGFGLDYLEFSRVGPQADL